ncbi:hypothetical protein NDU88_004686 [Pleurodeles waltl]|uniref:Uncharacterized protein n=1 Tax=Pleurodeles waltl TaxID=8319 RepID=A0AAV7WW79_PLEWA|nr:hypothetical protein NDU88_004686 [Pleurodeles waltl]
MNISPSCGVISAGAVTSRATKVLLKVISVRPHCVAPEAAFLATRPRSETTGRCLRQRNGATWTATK